MHSFLVQPFRKPLAINDAKRSSQSPRKYLDTPYSCSLIALPKNELASQYCLDRIECLYPIDDSENNL